MVDSLTSYCFTLKGYFIGVWMYLVLCGILYLIKRISTKRRIVASYISGDDISKIPQTTVGAMLLTVLVGFIPLMGYGLLVYVLAYCIVRMIVNGAAIATTAVTVFLREMNKPLLDPQKVIDEHIRVNTPPVVADNHAAIEE